MLLAKWLERWQKVVPTTPQTELATLAVFALREHARVLSTQLNTLSSIYDYAALSPSESADFHADMLVYQEALPDQHGLSSVFFLSALYECLRFGSERKATKRQTDSYFTPAYWAINFVNQIKKEELATGCQEKFFTIMEPCAGSGNLLFAFLGWVTQNIPELVKHLKFVAFEADQFHFHALKILWPLAVDSLRPKFPLPQSEASAIFLQANFLEKDQLKATPPADLILLNPPWSTSRPNIRRSARELNLAMADLPREKLPSTTPKESTPSYLEFLEAALTKLKPGGLLSAILPGGFLSDKSTSFLRRHLLDQGTWLRTCVLSNKQAHFPVHPDYEFLFLYFQAQGKTSAMSLVNEGTPQATLLQRSFLEKLSSRYLLIPSFVEAKSLTILEKMLETSTRLFSLETRGGGPFNYRREFDLSQLDRQTTKSTNHSLDVKENLLPVIEGRMLQAYGCACREWVHGHGRGASWKKSDRAVYGASHLIPESLYRKRVPNAGAKVAYVAVSGRQNRRMLKAALTPDLPHGSSVPVFSLPRETKSEVAMKKALPLVALLNSSCFDFFLRATLAGNNLNYYWLSQVPIPPAFVELHSEAYTNSITNALLQSLTKLAAKLSFDEMQVQLIVDEKGVILPNDNNGDPNEKRAQSFTGLSRQECAYLADIIIAKLYNLSLEEYELLFHTSLKSGFFHSYNPENSESSPQIWSKLACKLYSKPFSITCL
jgi:hypothetical protein